MGSYNGNKINIEDMPFYNKEIKIDRYFIIEYDKLELRDVQLLMEIKQTKFKALRNSDYSVIYGSNEFYHDNFSDMPTIKNRQGYEPYREGILYLKVNARFGLIVFIDFLDIENNDCQILMVIRYK